MAYAAASRSEHKKRGFTFFERWPSFASSADVFFPEIFFFPVEDVAEERRRFVIEVVARDKDIVSLVHAYLVHHVPFDHAAGGTGHPPHRFREAVYAAVEDASDGEDVDFSFEDFGGLFYFIEGCLRVAFDAEINIDAVAGDAEFVHEVPEREGVFAA